MEIMGLFDKIKRFFRGDDYNRMPQKIQLRINELRSEQSKLELKQKYLEQVRIETSWYKLNISEKENKDFVPFNPLKISKITTMKDLQEKRKQEEIEKILQLCRTVKIQFGEVQALLNRRQVKEAEELLYQIFPNIQYINKSEIQSTYEELRLKIVDIKNIIREENKRKKEEEERRQAEAEQKRLQEEIERREREKAEQRKRDEKFERLRAEVTMKKPNANKFLDYLQFKNVTCFYHFTDERNIPNIRKYRGLYSWYYCEKNNIDIPDSGGDNSSRNLDKSHGLQDYVHLSFCDDHPMSYRKIQSGSNLVLLKIKVDVAAFKETQFSDINAADSSNCHGSDYNYLERINIEATKQHYVKRTDDIFKQHQAECMVKTFIPIDYIINIDQPQKMMANDIH